MIIEGETSTLREIEEMEEMGKMGRGRILGEIILLRGRGKGIRGRGEGILTGRERSIRSGRIDPRITRVEGRVGGKGRGRGREVRVILEGRVSRGNSPGIGINKNYNFYYLF